MSLNLFKQFQHYDSFEYYFLADKVLSLTELHDAITHGEFDVTMEFDDRYDAEDAFEDLERSNYSNFTLVNRVHYNLIIVRVSSELRMRIDV